MIFKEVIFENESIMLTAELKLEHDLLASNWNYE
jgi:hypothetical protein